MRYSKDAKRPIEGHGLLIYSIRGIGIEADAAGIGILASTSQSNTMAFYYQTGVL
jgi:hypothetical protein